MFILNILTACLTLGSLVETFGDESAGIAEAITNTSAKVSGDDGAVTAKVSASTFANEVSREYCADTTEATVTVAFCWFL